MATAGSISAAASKKERPPVELSLERVVQLMLSAVPEDMGRFERLCGDVKNWEELFAYARTQGVAGVIWYYLAQPEIAVAAEVKKQAGRYLAVERMGRMRLREALDYLNGYIGRWRHRVG